MSIKEMRWDWLLNPGIGAPMAAVQISICGNMTIYLDDGVIGGVAHVFYPAESGFPKDVE